MKAFLNDSPIIACSSGHQENSAIAIIRISGFTDLSLFAQSFSLDISKVKNRFSHFTKLIDHKSKSVLDEILFVYFPENSSYTGEKLLEIHCHGNKLNIDRILDYFVSSYELKYAEGGEFSYRAYKNKKLSLSQVEGLDLFLNAQSDYALKAGMSGLSGEIDSDFVKLRDQFLEIKSAVELNIDFLEDIGEEQGNELLKDRVEIFGSNLEKLYKRCNSNVEALLSPDISIIGETNAGKSSLFNLILENDRSIVSDIHGTTRDYVSETINIKGQNFRLIDTAGLRETEDFVEKEGIKKSLEFSKSSFLKLRIIDPELVSTIDKKEFEHFNYILISKLDLLNEEKVKEIESYLKDFNGIVFIFSSESNTFIGPMGAGDFGPIGADENGSMGALGSESELSRSGSMGALSQTGPIGAPKNGFDAIFKELLFNEYSKLTKNDPLVIKRHISKINELHTNWMKIQTLILTESDIGIVSSQVNLFSKLIDELIGVLAPDQVLYNIFDNFCIGK
ncbi:MAG: GTP-binding protein [Oligoflexia bacterium]|nr:GTP-binding protein [Oligoflexia bacterium]